MSANSTSAQMKRGTQTLNRRAKKDLSENLSDIGNPPPPININNPRVPGCRCWSPLSKNNSNTHPLSSSRPHCDNVIAVDAQVSSPSSQWRCCPCCDGIVAVTNGRRLAVVHDDGDGATGDSIDDYCDSATNVNNDGDGVTDDEIDDDDCDRQRR
jgi:hypothetical protein